MSDPYECPPPNLPQNGCSAGISWFWNKFLGGPPSWEYCCDEHDLAYGEGITATDRRLADKRLLQCLSKYCNLQAYIFYGCLRLFGWIWFYLK
jgi:hypothetical protein